MYLDLYLARCLQVEFVAAGAVAFEVWLSGAPGLPLRQLADSPLEIEVVEEEESESVLLLVVLVAVIPAAVIVLVGCLLAWWLLRRRADAEKLLRLRKTAMSLPTKVVEAAVADMHARVRKVVDEEGGLIKE